MYSTGWPLGSPNSIQVSRRPSASRILLGNRAASVPPARQLRRLALDRDQRHIHQPQHHPHQFALAVGFGLGQNAAQLRAHRIHDCARALRRCP